MCYKSRNIEQCDVPCKGVSVNGLRGARLCLSLLKGNPGSVGKLDPVEKAVVSPYISQLKQK